jgi:integrase
MGKRMERLSAPIHMEARMDRRTRGKFNRLTAVAVVKLKTPGLHNDGGGLYLQIGEGGARSWLYRFRLHDKRRDMGLGSAAAISLADARELAAEARKLVASGRDPIAEREARRRAARGKKAGSFAALARELIETQEVNWRNAKHRQQWRSTFETYVFPIIGDRPVSEISVSDVKAVLAPIWREKPETARRVRQRIAAVLDLAIATELRTAGNVARVEIVKKVLPGHSTKPRHHPALPYADMHQFMKALRAEEGTAARALEFAILTAARSGEVRGVTWSEVDLEGRLWTVPADRMKANREHRVPLTDRVIAILKGEWDAAEKIKGRPDPAALVFVGVSKKTGGLSENAFGVVLERMGRGDITAHGFRSTFRDWAAEQTSFPREVAELALAHTIQDKTEAAYRRGDALDLRRELMMRWATWCSTPPRQGVLPFAPRKAGGRR